VSIYTLLDPDRIAEGIRELEEHIDRLIDKCEAREWHDSPCPYENASNAAMFELEQLEDLLEAH
jgi:hypothetical protein